MKILITGGNSSLALRLLKAFEHDEVILADYGEVPSLASSNYKLISLGEKNEDTLAHTLLNNCLDESVDAILPLHGFELAAVAKTKILFNEFNIDLILPDVEQLNTYLEEKQKSEDWIILKSGQLIFATNNIAAMDLPKNEGLSGAFYVNENSALNLVTIY